jgi:hypothetical protein
MTAVLEMRLGSPRPGREGGTDPGDRSLNGILKRGRREPTAHRKTAIKTLEAEVPLLVGLVRLTSAPEAHENTALGRVGAEDTIALLLTGGQIRHYEQMQSVTAFDGPDTICSRVLLQQDVQGVGTLHNVVIVAEERENELVQGFAAFYPQARVAPMPKLLAMVWGAHRSREPFDPARVHVCQSQYALAA